MRFKFGKVYLIQYLVSFEASLALGIAGVHYAWPGATFPILLDEKTTPIPTSSSQSAWIAGFLQIGAVFGAVIGFYIGDKYGRKRAIIMSTVPSLLSFLLIYLAKSVPVLYLARFFGGIAAGIAVVIVPVYVTEISSPEIRGHLNILAGVPFFIGTILEYSIVPYISLQLNGLICFFLTVVQGILVFYVPESPYYFIMTEQNDLAEKTLKFLRQKDVVNEVMDELKFGWMIQKSDLKDGLVNGKLDIIRNKLNRKCLVISFGIMIAQQFSGYVAIDAYSLVFLKEAEAPISTELSGIILSCLNLVFTVLSSFFVDSWGRKILLLLSVMLSTLPLFTIGLFYHLQSIGVENIAQYSLVPIIALVVFLFTFDIGLGTLPYTYTTEIFATKFKTTAAMLLSIFAAILGLFVTKFYQIVGDHFGIQYSFWIFTICCIFSTIFIVLFVPETKGKSLEQIQSDLRSSKN